ncbi:hypothetical protein SEA_JERM2_39 [Mycobacterium phage Jerm2]|nr:hypothetical protein SEA_JERM2_39 [Mycobacterium phage Jerm2]
MSKKKKYITVEQLAVITDRLTEAVDLLKIISTQTQSERRKVSAAQEIEAIRAEEAERYHTYRDKPLQPYVRVHEAP